MLDSLFITCELKLYNSLLPSHFYANYFGLQSFYYYDFLKYLKS